MQIFGFIYSKRKGTVAEKMEGHIDSQTKKERLSRLLEVKNEIINADAKEMVGKVYRVLVESVGKDGILYGSLDSGKTITIEGTENCVGEFLDVRVVNSRKSVIYGEIVDKEATLSFKKKDFKLPLEVSILPKDQKNMKMLRQNKQTVKAQNDNKSRK